MNMFTRGIQRVFFAIQNRAYYLDRDAKKQSALPQANDASICNELRAAGVEVVPYTIDGEGFENWLDSVPFPSDYVEAYGEVFTEKALEYYVGADLLRMEKDDILVDVAASGSPWHEIAEHLYRCSGYALDRVYPPGIRGRRIGADATKMPLPDGFATKMALHCAYEMFEGTEDIRLLSEAYRVLRNKGKMVILPLYLDDFYYVLSSPYTNTRGLDYGGAELVWRDDAYPLRFSRHYSVKAFCERIVANRGGFTLRLFHIENEKAISPKCYLKFAALFDKSAV